MRNGAQDILAAFFERELRQQRFEAGLILQIENRLQLGDAVFRQIEPVDDAAEEVHASQIDLEPRYAQPFESLDGDQQDFHVGRFSAAEMFDSALSKLALLAAFRLLKAQDVARVVEPDR